MTDLIQAGRLQFARQIAHWRAAIDALDEPANFASESAWREVEEALDLALRQAAQRAVNRLKGEADTAAGVLAAAHSGAALYRVRRDLLALRRSYGQVETMLHFYAQAVNTRTTPRLGALLRACDIIATQSLSVALVPLGRPIPPVLTYLDKGLGASILRAGLRLWDPHSISPAAAIKIARQNLTRPTSLVHESGHQVAFSLGWNDDLARTLQALLTAAAGRSLADTWVGWASEIAADVYAFTLTGYAAVAALHDVVAGEQDAVFRMPLGDPHPVAWIRVLLNVAFCRHTYGAGPWDDLAAAWIENYPLNAAPPGVRDLLDASRPQLPRIAAACLDTKVPAFQGHSLTALADPHAVSPTALTRLAAERGAALLSSPYLSRTECLPILALTGYQIATQPDRTRELTAQVESWMLRLGGRTKVPA